MSSPRALPRSPWLGLAAIVVLAAALRLPTLSEQSFWFDETATRVVVDGSFADMLRGVKNLEGSPPFFYAVTWLWAQLFGVGELSLRAVSALAGIALIPVLFALGRRVGGDRAGLLAALIAATSPFLVWFSQEARNYSLLVLLVALAAALAVRFDATGDRRAYAGFAGVSVPAVATHYFAAFAVVPLAVWLWRHERRPTGPLRWSPAAVAVAGLALLPLALHQSDRAKAATVGALDTRLAQLPKQLAVGYHSQFDTAGALVAGALVVAALGHAALRAEPPLRARVRWCLALVAAVILPLLALTTIGSDYLNTRNAIAALVPLCAALGIALAARGRLGLAAGAVLALIGTATVISVTADERAQRDDWRGAVRAMGPLQGARAIVTGDQSILPLRVYLPGARVATAPVAISEIDVLGLARRATGNEPEPPPPRTLPLPAAFGLVAVKRTEMYTLQRYRSAEPQGVTLDILDRLRLDDYDPQIYVEGPQ